MFCKNCGKENPNGSNHCKYCGTQLVSAVKKDPTKKTNALLFTIISLLAILILAIVGIFVVKPLIKGDNTTSSQSEKKKEKTSLEKEEEENGVTDEENVDDTAIEAESALNGAMQNLVTSPADGMKLILTDGKGADDDNINQLEVIGAVIQYSSYSITDYEVIDNETVTFEVTIGTLDFSEVMDVYVENSINYYNNAVENEGRIPTEDEMWEITYQLFFEAFNNYDYSGTETVESTQTITMINKGGEWMAESMSGIFDGIFYGFNEAVEIAGEALNGYI